MTAVDNENGRNIINPYIQISKYSENGTCCFLNTSTFGENCQNELIHPLNRKIVKLEKENKLYVVEAVVGEYNGSPCTEINILTTVSLTRAARSRNLLGYLEEDIIKKCFPHTFIELNR